MQKDQVLCWLAPAIEGAPALTYYGMATLIWQAAFLIWQAAFLIWQAVFLIWQEAFLIWQAAFLIWQAAFLIWQAAFLSWQAAFLLWQAAFLVGQAHLKPLTRSNVARAMAQVGICNVVSLNCWSQICRSSMPFAHLS
jgi:hypothetical protein